MVVVVVVVENSSVWVESPTEIPRRNTLTGSSPRCSKSFFSQIQLPVQTLTVSAQTPHVQSYASTSVRTLKTQTLAAIPLFGRTKILHILTGMGSTALAAAVPYPVR